LRDPFAAYLARTDYPWLRRGVVPFELCPHVFPGVMGKGPWTGGSPGGRALDHLQAMGRAVGVDGFGFLSLRHSWSTHAQTRWPVLGPARAAWMGHTTERTSLESYCHLDAANVRGLASLIVIPTSVAVQ